ncbi:MAG: radical SAM family heme chaperone HemW [Proteobacteria bacterium]|nr:radical SAM family heme chaperone HemW [Pseudomonadota bacterium]MBU1739449.1 radical SAM family heme chaperone HemW [Pseudomonadota bacterium]
MADQAPETWAGIYIHIPFCQSKCGYCSFVSYAGREKLVPDYLAALQKEIDFYAHHPLLQHLHFQSLFIGGGTPTVLSGEDLAQLVERVKHRFELSSDAEISIECNPNTLTPDLLASLTKSGVNRLSIGVQSFHDRILKKIGRIHTAKQAVAAIKSARENGFTNINLDLICGLPGQGVADLQEDVSIATKLSPDHLSLYQLSVDPGTAFAGLDAQGKLALPSEDEVQDMTEFLEQQLSPFGYRRYEISNYARPGRECRHNLVYWRNLPYLGLGCAAVSYLSGTRIRNSDDPDHYIRKLHNGEPAWIESEALSRESSFRETVIMGLRLIDGIDLEDLQARFAIDACDYYRDILPSLLAKELVRIENGRLRLSAKALPVANQILAELV